MKLIKKNEKRLITLTLLIAYLLICFSSFHSDVEAREYCIKRPDYIHPDRGESCGIYEKGISMASTVDHPTKFEIINAKQEAINKSQDKIYRTLLILAEQWSKVELSTEEKALVLNEFRKQLRVTSEDHPCETIGGNNRHICKTRSSLLLSHNSVKVKNIMTRIIDLRSKGQGINPMPSKARVYLVVASKNEMEIFSDAFSLKKKIRTDESLLTVHTVNLYFKRDDDDVRHKLYLRSADDHTVLINEKEGHSEGNEIVVVMNYPIRYMDISDQFYVKYNDKIPVEEAINTALNENAFRIYTSADEPLLENMSGSTWIPFDKINSYLPEEFVHWLNDSEYYKEFVLLISIKENDFFENYYVPKRIKFLNECDNSKQLTQIVQITSNDFFIPDVMSPDEDGYYSISLPKNKWKESCELSVSAPDFLKKTIGLDAFYREVPRNTRNEITLAPNKRHVQLHVARSPNVKENTFHLTYLVDSSRKMKLNLDFMNSDLFTESVAVLGGKDISSFDLRNNTLYKVNRVDHIQNREHICDEVIRLQIEKISD